MIMGRQVWTAFFLSNTILPSCMLYTYLKASVEWSGMRYIKCRGRVMRMNQPLAHCEA